MQHQKADNEFSAAQYSNTWSTTLLNWNDDVVKLRVLTEQLASNQKLIAADYAKVSLGGMSKQNGQISGLMVDVLHNLTWSLRLGVAAESSEASQLSTDEWDNILKTTPDWLKKIFEAATLLTALPSEEDKAKMAATQRVLVLRDPYVAIGGLLPQAAALMPDGFTVEDVRMWWPWIMGGTVPVLLAATENPLELREVSMASILSTEEAQAEVADIGRA